MHLSDYEKSMLQNVNAQVEVAQPQNTGKTIHLFCLAKSEIRFGRRVKSEEVKSEKKGEIRKKKNQ